MKDFIVTGKYWWVVPVSMAVTSLVIAGVAIGLG